jgi:sugar phosphate isomerase/epimerase
MTENTPHISRRQAIAQAGVLVGAALTSGPQTAVPAESRPPAATGGFLYCLNTATVRGQQLGIVKEVELAARAGYHAIEPWVNSIAAYRKAGGSLPELKHRIADLGLTVESTIAFPQWAVDDEARRAQGLEQAKSDLEMIAQIGGKRLAAPPSGATDLPRLDLLKVADRYRALLEIGDQFGIVPQLELWGFSKNLNRLGECVCVAIESNHPKACVLGDIYHLYKGGSGVAGLKLLSRHAMPVLHINDYPADPPRERIDDSHRVFPGDGVAPVTEILRALHDKGGTTVLSLELFHRKYWEMDALEVARAGLEKMKLAVAKALNQ